MKEEKRCNKQKTTEIAKYDEIVESKEFVIIYILTHN